MCLPEFRKCSLTKRFALEHDDDSDDDGDDVDDPQLLPHRNAPNSAEQPAI